MIKTNKKIELLAPAGSFEALTAAVQNGADAVYLGGKLFNARQFANNFSDDDLIKAIDYAHQRDVKLYLTLNTLMFDDEINKAYEFALFAYRNGIDAVIVQDLGLLNVLRKYIPDLPIHASTQMTIHNLDGVLQLKEFGVKRVVLARKLSLNKIKEIKK